MDDIASWLHRLRAAGIDPEDVEFETTAEGMELSFAEIGILANHEPLMAALATSTVNIQAGEDRIKATVGGGFLQILNNAVTLLVDEATLEED